MLKEKIFNAENIENKKSYIRYISENNWLVGNPVFINSKDNYIFIQNEYPSNFQSLNKFKTQFSCGICNKDRQSKSWFALNQDDYDLGCIHIKELIVAIYWGIKKNHIIPLLDICRFPEIKYKEPKSEIEIEKAKILLSNLKTPERNQIYFIRNIECLLENEFLNSNYNLISYPHLKWSENIINYNKRQFKCTCKESLNNKIHCTHIIKVIEDEKIKKKNLDFILFLINKYFED